MKIFFTIFITLIFCSGTTFAVTANISQFVFTTDVQSVSLNTISDEIVVQTQNSGGESEKVDETNDVTFLSSSPTGEFLNSSGGVVTTTMSKNTSSRTFYYKDSTEGSHTLTVKIKGRDSGKEFSVNQKINIGNVSSGSNASGQTSSLTNSSNTSFSDYSSHSAQESISSFGEIFEYKLSIGRKRLVLVNTPVYFEPKFSGLPINYSRPSFDWTFGDGTNSYLGTVNHSYKFPGIYIVILNTNISGNKAVSRTEVKVINPEIEINEYVLGKNGYVSITNKSSEEINLDGWAIRSPNTVYFIPKDTIINSKSVVKMPFVFEDSPINLFDPASNLVFSGKQSNQIISTKISTEKNINASSLFYQKYNELNSVSQGKLVATSSSIILKESEGSEDGLVEAYEKKKEDGFVRALFASPNNPLGKIKRWLSR